MRNRDHGLREIGIWQPLRINQNRGANLTFRLGSGTLWHGLKQRPTKDAVKALCDSLGRMDNRLPQVRTAGVEALHRLLPLAQEDDAQGEVVRALLLGCYNGRDFPFPLNSIRVLDRAVLNDCLALL